MKKNQILALLLAAVMLLAVLTGCAAKTEPAQTEPAPVSYTHLRAHETL